MPNWRRAIRVASDVACQGIIRMAPSPAQAICISPSPLVLIVRTSEIRRRIFPSVINGYSAAHGFDFRYHRDRSRAHSLILDGPWDRVLVPALGVPDYAAFREHFIEGRPWTETRRYRQLVRVLTPEDRRRWLERASFWDDLYEEIRANGYRRQEAVHPGMRLGNRSIEGSPLNEIQVAVTRKGEIVRIEGGGNHRFLMAHLLGIEEIPVVVNAWHARFVSARLAAQAKAEPAPATANSLLQAVGGAELPSGSVSI